MGSLILGSFLHISIHALLAESDHNAARGVPVNTISIHALLAESDRPTGSLSHQICISIHALLAESDASGWRRIISLPTFLSTLSLRRATEVVKERWRSVISISIHALLAESDALPAQRQTKLQISIHALLAESDPRLSSPFWGQENFYPRSPCGERQRDPDICLHPMHFYPRSPCGERLPATSGTAGCTNFYPRSPCGERRCGLWLHQSLYVFLSTLSLRRATAKVHKTVGHFCAYETNFMGIASSC